MADLGIVKKLIYFLADSFRDLSDQDLAWLSFWLVAEKK